MLRYIRCYAVTLCSIRHLTLRLVILRYAVCFVMFFLHVFMCSDLLIAFDLLYASYNFLDVILIQPKWVRSCSYLWCVTLRWITSHDVTSRHVMSYHVMFFFLFSIFPCRPTHQPGGRWINPWCHVVWRSAESSLFCLWPTFLRSFHITWAPGMSQLRKRFSKRV